MTWNHILIEAYCTIKEGTKLPICCKFGAGNISINCLGLKEKGEPNKTCPYLVFGETRSTIALTNKHGDVIISDEFESGEQDAAKWEEMEKEWLKVHEKYIKEDISSKK